MTMGTSVRHSMDQETTHPRESDFRGSLLNTRRLRQCDTVFSSRVIGRSYVGLDDIAENTLRTLYNVQMLHTLHSVQSSVMM